MIIPPPRDLLLRKIIGLGERSFQKSYYPELQRKLAELQKTQQALQESEAKYRLLVNQIPAVVFKGYADWRVDFFDNKIEALTGYSREDFDSRRLKWSDVILIDDFLEIRRKARQSIKSGARTYEREYRIRRQDDSIAWIQAIGQISYNAAGNIDYVSGVFFDITARKRAEAALSEEAARRRLLMEQSRDGIVILDQDGKVYEANQKYAEMLGYSLEFPLT